MDTHNIHNLRQHQQHNIQTQVRTSVRYAVNISPSSSKSKYRGTANAYMFIPLIMHVAMESVVSDKSEADRRGRASTAQRRGGVNAKFNVQIESGTFWWNLRRKAKELPSGRDYTDHQYSFDGTL